MISDEYVHPIYHDCGAVVLYSRVPVTYQSKLPGTSDLVYADGRWPKQGERYPDCVQCGETLEHRLKSRSSIPATLVDTPPCRPVKWWDGESPQGG